MKAGIHPLYVNSKVVCACGNTFETRSTKELIKLEICSACHPFFTGQQKLVDTAGRVDRFIRRFKATEGKTVMREIKAAAPRKLAPMNRIAKKKVLTTAPTKEAKPRKPVKKAA